MGMAGCLILPNAQKSAPGHPHTSDKSLLKIV